MLLVSPFTCCGVELVTNDDYKEVFLFFSGSMDLWRLPLNQNLITGTFRLSKLHHRWSETDRQYMAETGGATAEKEAPIPPSKKQRAGDVNLGNKNVAEALETALTPVISEPSVSPGSSENDDLQRCDNIAEESCEGEGDSLPTMSKCNEKYVRSAAPRV